MKIVEIPMSHLTVFIHGTLPPKALRSLSKIERFFRCPKGLTSLADFPDSHTKDILMSLSTHYPQEFPADHCYAFGWSGILSSQARKKAAQELYEQLLPLIAQDDSPHLTLLTHSHGGNVALYLDHIVPNTASDQFKIAQLILLACPVQTETAHAINSTLFTDVYSLHSHHDLLQVIDPQGVHTFIEYLNTKGLEFTMNNLKQLGPLFSERHFPADSKVKQLNVRHHYRELLHIEFLLPQFMKALPSLVAKLKNHPKTGVDVDDLTHIFRE